MRKRTPLLLCALCALCGSSASCAGAARGTLGPNQAELPIPGGGKGGAGPNAAREQPPPPLPARDAPFPKVFRDKLPNGLTVETVEAHALPIVQVRILIGAGNGYGLAPAVPKLTAELLKDGGTRTMRSAELLRRIESLGADLSIDVDFDTTRIALGVTRSHVADALALAAEMIEEPAFDDKELVKLKARETDEAKDNARSNGAWMATRAMFHELWTEQNPYAWYDVVPSEIAKVNGLAVRDFHKRYYVPKNTRLVVVGDVDAGETGKLAAKVFGAWKGGDPPKADFPPAIPLARRRVLVVNRPKSTQSDIFVATLAPPRKAPDWPAVRVANQVLGGVPSGRLFLDVREQRSLAYSAASRIIELANGEEPLAIYVGTQTPKTADAVRGVLENLERIASQTIASDEVTSARRYLSDVFALRMETIGAIAELVSTADVLGLPDGYYDRYRDDLRHVSESDASTAAARLFKADKVLVVAAGDADAIAPPLARFGEVTVLDPEREFQSVRTIPAGSSN